MKTNNDNVIRFAIPIDIEKGISKNGNSTYIFKGLASTPTTDSQGETLYADRYDLSNFKDVNWNHKAKDDANAYLGQIVEHSFQKGGLYVKGELFEEMPMTNAVVNLMKALNRRGKKLQLSVEGQVVQRGSNDKKSPLYNQILKAKLTGVAITNNPINADTFCELIEKGYTNNNWTFDEEAISLEEDVLKSMDVAAEKPTTGESVEGAHEKNLSDAKKARKKNSKKEGKDGDDDDEEEEEETEEDHNVISDKKVLSKSLAYEAIFRYFYPVDIEKAKVIYQLLEKISTMSKTPITAETLKKAQEILNLAASSDTKTLVSAKEHISSLEDKTLSKAEVLASLLQEGYEEELAKSAVVDYIPETKTAGGTDTTEIAKALNALSLESATQRNDITVKFGAIGLILKSQNDLIESLVEQNEELKKSNESLIESINKISENTERIVSSPVYKKPITRASSGVERFEKSEDGMRIFNVKDKISRRELATVLEDLSGINTAAQRGGKFDEQLMKASQEIEMIGAFADPAVQSYLETVHKIRVVSE